MDRVGNELSVKYSARDIPFSKDSDLFGKFQSFKVLDDLEISGTVRFVNAFKFTLNEYRSKRPILRKLVFEPADGQVPPKRITIVEIGPDDGSFKIKAKLHKCWIAAGNRFGTLSLGVKRKERNS